MTNLIGLVIEATGLRAEVGEAVQRLDRRNRPMCPPKWSGSRDGRDAADAARQHAGHRPGTPVSGTGDTFSVPVGDHLLGRVLDGLGRPIDEGPPIRASELRPAAGPPPSPMTRSMINRRLPLGVRALDTLVPCGRGQRLGIFAGSGSASAACWA